MRILVVDDSEERGRAVRESLTGVGTVVGQVQSSADLREVLGREDVDVIIASLSSPDRDTLDSLREGSAANPKPVVMFVDEAGADMAADAVRSGVSAYVVDGFAEHRVRAVLQVAITRFDEFQRLRSELEQSKAALADRKTIDKAKGILMAQKGLTEADAYSLLRRSAMAQNQRLIDVARSVIAVAEMLK